MFKNLEERTISASGELGLLQTVLKLDTGRCASEEDEPRRGVDTRRCANKDTGSGRGWIVRSHIGWGGERNILYKGVEISP